MKKKKADLEALRQVGIALLLAIGEDPTRAGLVDTPARFARQWAEFVDFDPGRTTTAFAVKGGCDEMVVVSGMRLYSICEHHLLPFWCDVSVGYIPATKDGVTVQVLGLSKFARIAHKHARRLQIQETLVNGIAQELLAVTGSLDVAVIGRGEHSCMSTRGIKTRAVMTTSVVRGRFKDDAQTRSEFLSLALA